eukprot:952198-Rhodomonas_salina.6
MFEALGLVSLRCPDDVLRHVQALTCRCDDARSTSRRSTASRSRSRSPRTAGSRSRRLRRRPRSASRKLPPRLPELVLGTRLSCIFAFFGGRCRRSVLRGNARTLERAEPRLVQDERCLFHSCRRQQPGGDANTGEQDRRDPGAARPAQACSRWCRIVPSSSSMSQTCFLHRARNAVRSHECQNPQTPSAFSGTRIDGSSSCGCVAIPWKPGVSLVSVQKQNCRPNSAGSATGM